MNVFKLVKSDFLRYKATGGVSDLKIIFFNQGFFFTTVFRINTAVYNKLKKIPVINKLTGLHCLIWLKISQIISGLSIPVGLKLGKGIFISHAGTIIINSNCEVGDNCNFAPDTVIGFGILDGISGYPKIGNRVFVGPGAKIFGPIVIGDDVAVGANAVINKSVPDKAVVAGVPGKIVSYKGSFDYIQF